MSYSTLDESPNVLNKTLLQKYLDLPQPENAIQVEYIWIDNTNERLRSKTRTLSFVPKQPSNLPSWILENIWMSDNVKKNIYLYPVAIYNDPFRRGNNKLVLCDTYYSDETPTETNKRYRANQAMESTKDQEPWFSIEYACTFIDFNGRQLNWNKNISHLNPYDHSIDVDKVMIGREIIEAHYRACLYAGVKLAGTKFQVVPDRWEFQVGPCTGISAGDDLLVARFILHRIAEEYGVIVMNPKKDPIWWYNVGAYTNFSTKAMRGENGIVEIERAIEKLSKQHLRHVQAYDPRGEKDGERRLTDRFERDSIRNFSAGVAEQNVSIRIPLGVAEEMKGYLQDRRPSINSNPYSVCDALVRTCVLNE